jgi:hypothetical protein
MTVPPFTPPSGEQPRPYGGSNFPTRPQGDYYGPSYQPPASKAMAGWALALSILTCWGVGTLVSIGLGIAVLVKSQRDGRNHGKGLAIAALIINALWIVATVVIVVLMVTGTIEIDDSERDPDGEISKEQDISLTSLRVGDCLGIGVLAEMRSEGLFEVNVVPCSEPHSGELFHLFDLADGDYPGDDEVIRLAETGCLDAFRAYVGVPPARSTIGVTYNHPVAIGWRIADDRGVYCFLSEADESTTGSLKGAKR